MSVPEQVPYKEYRATGSSNTFEITFHLPDPKDLVVMVNKEIPPVGAYSIQGNTVVFNTPPNKGDLVELTRDTQMDRETNFKSYDNSFRPETINFDLDKIWLVLQESNLVDAKILARLKQEIEWRRTHDFNYDELAQVREKQLFDALKSYTDTLNAATNPGVFQGVIAGVVFARDGKSIQTHLEEILEALAQERENIDSKADKQYVDDQLDLKANQQTTYNKTEVDTALSLKAPQSNTYTKAEVDTTFAAYVGGRKAYTTLASAQAAQSSLPANTAIEVTNDGANNGTYQWNGTTLTKSAYDPLTQAKADATTKANAAEVNAKNYTDSKTPTKHISKDVVFSIADDLGNSIATLEDDGTLKIPGTLKAPAIEDANGLITSELQPKESISPYAYSIADENGNPILKIKQDGTLVVKSVVSNNTGVPFDKQFNNISQLDIFITHGQSNGAGRAEFTSPPVTTTQQFNNLNLDGGYFNPLVVALDEGEQPGYNLVNHLTYMTERDVSLDTSALSSQNGVFGIAQSGTKIANLYGDDSYSYGLFVEWLTAIKNSCDALNITCNVKAMSFTHGESDGETPSEEYLQHQYALYNTFNNKAKEITGQKNDMKFLTWLLSTNLSAPNVRNAQIKAHYQHPNMLICFPKYCGYFSEGTHLDALGVALAGAYYAVAYRYHFLEGKNWQPLIHESCAKYGTNAVKVRYARKGLTFDNSRFSAVGGGFYGTDENGDLTVSNYEVNNSGDVIITFNRDIVGSLTFGYGRQTVRTDSGNQFGGTLRDSDGLFEKTIINGVEHPLHNWALNFEEVVK